jgi:hypothetical protein
MEYMQTYVHMHANDTVMGLRKQHQHRSFIDRCQLISLMRIKDEKRRKDGERLVKGFEDGGKEKREDEERRKTHVRCPYNL